MVGIYNDEEGYPDTYVRGEKVMVTDGVKAYAQANAVVPLGAAAACGWPVFRGIMGRRSIEWESLGPF